MRRNPQKTLSPTLNYTNPFALSKAIGAATLTTNISAITTKACFVIKDREEYLRLIESAHQTLVYAVKMAEDARNLQKATNELYKAPHSKDGKIVKKTNFYDKPVE